MKTIINAAYYNGYELRRCSDAKMDQGFYQETLDRINDLICCSREYYSKATFITFILKFPSQFTLSHEDGNLYVSRLLNTFRNWYLDKYPTNKPPLYLWVREQSSTGQIHYHVVLVVNGQYIQQGGRVWDYINMRWNSYFSEYGPAPVDFGYTRAQYGSNDDNVFKFGAVKIDHSKVHSVVVYSYRDVYEHLSYFAKVYSKIHSDDPRIKSKNFGCSRMKRSQESIEEVDLRIRGYERKHQSGNFFHLT